MTPETSMYDRRRTQGRLVGPSVVAILFAALSVLSFAVDHRVTLAPLPGSPQTEESR